MIATEAQQGARELAPNPHRVELVGTPGALAWPELCPNCGAPAHERVRVGKVFVLNYQLVDLPTRYRVCRVAIPFCSVCAARHRSEQPAASRAERLLTVFLTGMAIPMVLMGAAALFCAREAIAALPDQAGAAFMGGVGLLFAIGSAVCARSSWTRSARLRVRCRLRAVDYRGRGGIAPGAPREMTTRHMCRQRRLPARRRPHHQ